MKMLWRLGPSTWLAGGFFLAAEVPPWGWGPATSLGWAAPGRDFQVLAGGCWMRCISSLFCHFNFLIPCIQSCSLISKH